MAVFRDKTPKNVPGQFYVDHQCIEFDVCRAVAPNNFSRDDETGQSYVSKQPENLEEFRQVYDAIIGCSVEAIGDDGLNPLPPPEDYDNVYETKPLSEKPVGFFTRLIRKIMS